MKKLYLIFVLFSISFNVLADVDVTVFTYEEKETGTDAVDMRYLVNESFIRIDNGTLLDDFILFDRNKKTIFSVSQEDQSILVIKSHKWSRPSFSFSVEENKSLLNDAPKIAGKSVMDYSKSVNEKLCQRIQLVPGLYQKEMQVFIEYQNVLTGQQVKILHTTPEEMQTPCFLVDQVYNTGEYYKLGLPIQEWHSRGYSRFLINYNQLKVTDEWFVLPDSFRRYSITEQ